MTGDEDSTVVGDQRRTLLRVVRGDPTPEEVAALTVVLAARASQPADPPAAPRSLWRDRAPLLRQPLRAGPAAWRASAHPR